MKAKELSEIHILLEELVEAIKRYDECNAGHNGNRVVYLCESLWENENFSGSRFSEYIENLNREPYYLNKIATHIRELINLGIDGLTMIIDRAFNDKKFYYPFWGNYGEECYISEYTYTERFKMFEEIHHTAKEILDIYNYYVFPNSRADNTESNKKDAEELTEREIKYYGKAIEAGMAEKTEDGYKWLYNKCSNASLAYFLYKLFDQDGTGQIPFKRLGKLWSVKRLDTALWQALNPKKYKQSWRTQIENLFTE